MGLMTLFSFWATVCTRAHNSWDGRRWSQ